MQSLHVAIVVSVLFAATSVVVCHRGGASCVEVRRTFASKNIGQQKLVPMQAKKTRKLKICSNSLPTCCTRRMENKYKKAANVDITKLLDQKLSSFKRDFNTFANNFDSDLRDIILQSRNVTIWKLRNHFANETEASSLQAIVDSFYHSVIIGKDEETLLDVVMRLQSSVKEFFAQLFSFTFQQHTSLTLDKEQLQCVADMSESTLFYDTIPHQITEILKTSLNQTSLFASSLKSGSELIDVAGRSLALKECRDGLVKMQFCSHCYGLTLLKPCQGLCQNIVRGCLVGITEMGRLWPNYVTGLAAMMENMTEDGRDIESALAEVTDLVEEALQAKLPKTTIRSIKETCNLSAHRQKRASEKLSNDDMTSSRRKSRRRRRNRNTYLLLKYDSIMDPKRQVPPPHLMLNNGPSIPFEVDRKARKYERARKEASVENGEFEIDRILKSEEAKLHLKSKMRRFVATLNKTIDILFSLPDELCDPEQHVSFPVATRGRCWDGEDMVESYNKHVAAKGLDGQFNNPEMKITGLHPEVGNAVKNLHLSSKTMILRSGKSQLPPAMEEYYLLQTHPAKSATAQPFIAPCGDDEDNCAGSGFENTDEIEDAKPRDMPKKVSKEDKKEVKDRKIKKTNTEKPSSKTPYISSTSSLDDEMSNAMSILVRSSEITETEAKTGSPEKRRNGGNSAPGILNRGVTWRTILLQSLFVLTVRRYLL